MESMAVNCGLKNAKCVNKFILLCYIPPDLRLLNKLNFFINRLKQRTNIGAILVATFKGTKGLLLQCRSAEVNEASYTTATAVPQYSEVDEQRVCFGSWI